MVANLICPTCGHKCRLSENAAGQPVRCPACLNLFTPVPPQAAPSLFTRPGAAEPDAARPPAPVNRTMLGETEATIRYNCPRCKKPLESPVSQGGQKLQCPHCNQRLQVPSQPPVNKTILAVEEPPVPSAPPRQPVVPRSAPAVPVLDVEMVEEAPAGPALRESCLECGTDLTQRARIQTCPSCGSSFCSAACYREHQLQAHTPKSKPKARTRFVECDRCGSTSRPYRTTTISSSGWAVFVILLFLFFPLCWIGLLITESETRCFDCRARL